MFGETPSRCTASKTVRSLTACWLHFQSSVPFGSLASSSTCLLEQDVSAGRHGPAAEGRSLFSSTEEKNKNKNKKTLSWRVVTLNTSCDYCIHHLTTKLLACLFSSYSNSTKCVVIFLSRLEGDSCRAKPFKRYRCLTFEGSLKFTTQWQLNTVCECVPLARIRHVNVNWQCIVLRDIQV